MKNTIIELYRLQFFYFKNLIDNIPEHLLFEETEHQLNSPGWILMHLIVEVEDVFKHLSVEIPSDDLGWIQEFKKDQNNYSKKVGKQELVEVFRSRYHTLAEHYLELSSAVKQSAHPSKMLKAFYSNTETWLLHHLVNHLAVHSGNISVWKKLMQLEVNGF